MRLDFKNTAKDAIHFVWLALRALMFWRQDQPVETPAALAQFVETRAKYAAQKTLFGYVKTRAGTRYPLLFEDKVFAASFDTAKWEVFLACLADLSVYAAARIGRGSQLDPNELPQLAIYIYRIGLAAEAVPRQRPEGFAGDEARFADRLKSLNWTGASESEASFGGSVDALVHWAPVADELKKYDVEAIRNSLRFQWKAVRDELNKLLDADAVAAGWRDNPPAEPSE